MPLKGFAGPKEEYEESYYLYVAAGASIATYNDRIAKLANQYLEQNGWKIDRYGQEKGHSGARFLLLQKPNEAGGITYVAAIVGTETLRDIRTDLKVDKVYFAGTNLEEFAMNAAKKNIPDTEPKVHRGFHEFIQTGHAATLHNNTGSFLSLNDLIENNPNNKLYLTGHSLGGAAATLAGARLISTGINPEKMEVITFGAPAVGNAAFAAKFEPVLRLTRVINSGDPVTGVLQNLVGGYTQFGREIKWELPAAIDDPHQLTAYIDAAIKNYYDKRRLAVQAGMELPKPTATKQADHGRIYLAPLKTTLPDALRPDFSYMQDTLQDEYRRILLNYIAPDNNETVDWQKAALDSGCRWAIVSEVSATRLKQERNIYYITLYQTIYDVTAGASINTAIFSTGTYNLTPLEAFIHTFKGMSAHMNDWFAEKNP